MLFVCLMIILTGSRVVYSSFFYLTTALIGTLISASAARLPGSGRGGFVIVKHRRTVTPVASVVVSDMLLSWRPCRRFVEALTRCCRVPFDVLLNEATPISSLRQGETAGAWWWWWWCWVVVLVLVVVVVHTSAGKSSRRLIRLYSGGKSSEGAGGVGGTWWVTSKLAPCALFGSLLRMFGAQCLAQGHLAEEQLI